jgi:hypothetical protein
VRYACTAGVLIACLCVLCLCLCLCLRCVLCVVSVPCAVVCAVCCHFVLCRLGWGVLSLGSVGVVTEAAAGSGTCTVNFGGTAAEVSVADLECLPDDPRAVKTGARQASTPHAAGDALRADDCVVCLDATACVTLVHGTTGHLCVCEECAVKMKDCPLCRVPIKAAVRTFFTKESNS